jgi:hypothetical protein
MNNGAAFQEKNDPLRVDTIDQYFLGSGMDILPERPGVNHPEDKKSLST